MRVPKGAGAKAVVFFLASAAAIGIGLGVSLGPGPERVTGGDSESQVLAARPDVSADEGTATSSFAPQPSGSLSFAVPAGWPAAVVVHARQGVYVPLAAPGSERLYISWALTNTGVARIWGPFFVDLELDGLVVERWSVEGLEPAEMLRVADWPALGSELPLAPGEHHIRLRLDSTGLLAAAEVELKEVTTSFRWRGTPAHPAQTTVARERLPNLAPVAAGGWDAPIVVYSRDADGTVRLPTVDLPTYVRIAYGNTGLSSLTQRFNVHLYLDGVLVARYEEAELVAGEQVVTPEWEGLAEVVRPKPGLHVLTVMVDPAGVVDERTTDDNVAVREFEWLSGEPAAPSGSAANVIPAAFAVQPFVPPLWDSPIVASQTPGTFSSPYVLSSEELTYLQWAVRNSSTEPSGPYTVRVWLDGEPLAQWERLGLPPGGVDVALDWPLFWAGSYRFSGVHRLTFDVRPKTQAPGVPLAFTAYREHVWGNTTAAVVSPRVYTQEELQARVRSLDGLLSLPSSVLASDPLVARQVLDVADAVYYTLYQRSLFDENLVIHLLKDTDYAAWVAVECADRAALVGSTAYGVACGQLAGAAGYAGFWRSHYRVVLRSDRPALQTLMELAHELGHVRQSLLRPDLDVLNGSFNLSALREAQAYVHEVLFLRTLEQMLGHPVLRYPDLDGFRRFVGTAMDGLVTSKEQSEHARGRLLLWLTALSDPYLAQQKGRLLDRGYLTRQDAAVVQDYLMQVSPGNIDRFVNGRLAALARFLPTIRELSAGRLVPGLSYLEEGSPYLRDVGLLSP